jgi:two-component system, LytTR family, response regulator LytT
MEKKITIVIADDERYNRDELKHLLQSFPVLQVIGEAETGEAAIMKSIQLQPDVIFLDVEMPKMNGMQAAKSLMELKKVPIIIFATAYPEFAAEAFRYEAVDYLLKPYDEEQLLQTIHRIEKLLHATGDLEGMKPTGKLAVEEDGEIRYIEPSEILYMLRDDKVTKIMTKSGEYESKTPLKDLETRLTPYSFFRIHKSYLVNLSYVKRLTPWFNGAYQLELEGVKDLLSVSRNYVKALRGRLEL